MPNVIECGRRSRAAGPEAVTGFRQVLEAMMDQDMRNRYDALKDLKGG